MPFIVAVKSTLQKLYYLEQPDGVMLLTTNRDKAFRPWIFGPFQGVQGRGSRVCLFCNILGVRGHPSIQGVLNPENPGLPPAQPASYRALDPLWA